MSRPKINRNSGDYVPLTDGSEAPAVSSRSADAYSSDRAQVVNGAKLVVLPEADSSWTSMLLQPSQASCASSIKQRCAANRLILGIVFGFLAVVSFASAAIVYVGGKQSSQEASKNANIELKTFSVLSMTPKKATIQLSATFSNWETVNGEIGEFESKLASKNCEIGTIPFPAVAVCEGCDDTHIDTVATIDLENQICAQEWFASLVTGADIELSISGTTSVSLKIAGISVSYDGIEINQHMSARGMQVLKDSTISGLSFEHSTETHVVASVTINAYNPSQLELHEFGGLTLGMTFSGAHISDMTCSVDAIVSGSNEWTCTGSMERNTALTDLFAAYMSGENAKVQLAGKSSGQPLYNAAAAALAWDAFVKPWGGDFVQQMEVSRLRFTAPPAASALSFDSVAVAMDVAMTVGSPLGSAAPSIAVSSLQVAAHLLYNGKEIGLLTLPATPAAPGSHGCTNVTNAKGSLTFTDSGAAFSQLIADIVSGATIDLHLHSYASRSVVLQVQSMAGKTEISAPIDVITTTTGMQQLTPALSAFTMASSTADTAVASWEVTLNNPSTFELFGFDGISAAAATSVGPLSSADCMLQSLAQGANTFPCTSNMGQSDALAAFFTSYGSGVTSDWTLSGTLSAHPLFSAAVQAMKWSVSVSGWEGTLLTDLSFTGKQSFDVTSDDTSAITAAVVLTLTSPLGVSGGLELASLHFNGVQLLHAATTIARVTADEQTPSAVSVGTDSTRSASFEALSLSASASASDAGWTQFLRSVVSSDTVSVGLTSSGAAAVQVGVRSVAGDVVLTVPLDVSARFAGMAGLPTSVLASFDLESSTQTRAVPSMALTLSNPSQVTVSGFGGVTVEWSESTGTVAAVTCDLNAVQPGDNTAHCTGTAEPTAQLASFFQRYASGSASTGKLTGLSAQTSVLSQAVAALAWDVVVPAWKGELITGIEYTGGIALSMPSQAQAQFAADTTITVASPLGAHGALSLTSIAIDSVALTDGAAETYGSATVQQTAAASNAAGSGSARSASFLSLTAVMSDVSANAGVGTGWSSLVHDVMHAADVSLGFTTSTARTVSVGVKSVAGDVTLSVPIQVAAGFAGMAGLTDTSISAFSMTDSTSEAAVGTLQVSIANPSAVCIQNVNAFTVDMAFAAESISYQTCSIDSICAGQNVATCTGKMTKGEALSSFFSNFVSDTANTVAITGVSSAQEAYTNAIAALKWTGTVQPWEGTFVSDLTLTAFDIQASDSLAAPSFVPIDLDTQLSVANPLGVQAGTLQVQNITVVAQVTSGDDTCGQMQLTAQAAHASRRLLTLPSGDETAVDTYTLSGGSELALASDGSGFAAFLGRVIEDPSAQLSLSTEQDAMAIVGVSGVFGVTSVRVPFRVTSSLKGMDGLHDVTVQSLQFIADKPGQVQDIAVELVLAVTNPADVTLPLGDVFSMTLQSSAGATLGSVSASGAVLQPGTNTLTLVGFIEPPQEDMMAASAWLTNWISGRTQTVIITGTSTSIAGGGAPSWLLQAVRDIQLSAAVEGDQDVIVFTAGTLSDVSIDTTATDVHFSASLTTDVHLPFPVPMDINHVNVSLQLAAVDTGDVIATADFLHQNSQFTQVKPALVRGEPPVSGTLVITLAPQSLTVASNDALSALLADVLTTEGGVALKVVAQINMALSTEDSLLFITNQILSSPTAIAGLAVSKAVPTAASTSVQFTAAAVRVTAPISAAAATVSTKVCASAAQVCALPTLCTAVTDVCFSQSPESFTLDVSAPPAQLKTWLQTFVAAQATPVTLQWKPVAGTHPAMQAALARIQWPVALPPTADPPLLYNASVSVVDLTPGSTTASFAWTFNSVFHCVVKVESLSLSIAGPSTSKSTYAAVGNATQTSPMTVPADSKAYSPIHVMQLTKDAAAETTVLEDISATQYAQVQADFTVSVSMCGADALQLAVAAQELPLYEMKSQSGGNSGGDTPAQAAAKITQGIEYMATQQQTAYKDQVAQGMFSGFLGLGYDAVTGDITLPLFTFDYSDASKTFNGRRLPKNANFAAHISEAGAMASGYTSGFSAAYSSLAAYRSAWDGYYDSLAKGTFTQRIGIFQGVTIPQIYDTYYAGDYSMSVAQVMFKAFDFSLEGSPSQQYIERLFEASVMLLPTDYSESEYQSNYREFLQHWGTHVIVKSTTGAYIEQRDLWKYYLSQDSINLQSNVEVSFERLTGYSMSGVHLSKLPAWSAAYAASGAVEHQPLTCRGGNAAELCSAKDMPNFIKSIADIAASAPIDLEIVPIYEVVPAQFSAQRTNLQRAVESYLSEEMSGWASHTSCPSSCERGSKCSGSGIACSCPTHSYGKRCSECEYGWGGSTCSVPQCVKYGCNSQHGHCTAPDHCVCDSCYSGSACQTYVCTCFDASGTVQTEDNRTVSVAEVQLGDRILSIDHATGKLVYSDVYYKRTTSLVAEETAVVYDIQAQPLLTASTNGEPPAPFSLKVTGDHLVYVYRGGKDIRTLTVSSSTPVPARAVMPGDILWTQPNAHHLKLIPCLVTNVTHAERQATLVTVHTLTGSAVVSGVVASTYEHSQVLDEWLNWEVRMLYKYAPSIAKSEWYQNLCDVYDRYITDSIYAAFQQWNSESSSEQIQSSGLMLWLQSMAQSAVNIWNSL